MIYFDNAATTLRKPDCVIEAVVQAMQSFGNSGRGVHGGAVSASRIIYDARAALAAPFGAESPERIAFTANSTQARHTAIKGVLNHHGTGAQLRPPSPLRAGGWRRGADDPACGFPGKYPL